MRVLLLCMAGGAGYAAYEGSSAAEGKHHEHLGSRILEQEGKVTFSAVDPAQEFRFFDAWRSERLRNAFGISLRRVSGVEIANNRSFSETELQSLDLESFESLEALDMSGLHFSDDFLLKIAKLPKLRKLLLNDTPAGDEGLKHLSEAQSLEYLSLCRTKITDKGLAALGTLRNLKTLHLTQTNVTGDGIRAIGRNHPKLQEISLAEIPLGDDDLVALGELTQLGQADLQGTLLTDEAMKALGHCRRLRDLNVNRTRVGGHGLAHLKGTSLQKLRMAGAPVTDHGLRRGFAAPENFSGLTEVDLSRTHIGRSGLQSVVSLPQLSVVQLEHLPRLTDGDMELFSGCRAPSLRVGLGGNPQLTEKSMETISRARSAMDLPADSNTSVSLQESSTAR